MPVRLEGPPVNEPMMVKDSGGNMVNNPVWLRWHLKSHLKMGGTDEVLPVHLGGTGAATIVQAIANQTSSESGSGSTSNASTQRKTFVLDSPESNDEGAFSDTVCVWDAAFPDATYTVTGAFSSPSNGLISIFNVTANTFTVRLTNLKARQASGTADCIGVHP